MIDKYGMFMQYNNIIFDTSKKTDESKIAGKWHKLQRASVVLMSWLFTDSVELALE